MIQKEGQPWYKIINSAEVPTKLRIAGEKMLSFVKADLELPKLRIDWCIQDTAENERVDTDKRFALFDETGQFDNSPYRTEEAFNFPTLESLYILADKPVEYAIRHIALRAKVYKLYKNPLWPKIDWSRHDPANDPWAYAEDAATQYLDEGLDSRLTPKAAGKKGECVR